jgi:TRAP-type C4-dicarboxylate transport system permease large subunit
MTEFVRNAVPFLVALVAILLFVAFVPETVLFLANRY